MKRKCIVLLETLNTEWDLQKRYLDDIEKREFDLEIWSLEKIFFPQSKVAHDKISSKWNVEYFTKNRDVKEKIRQNGKAVYFYEFGGLKRKKVKILYYLTKYECEYYGLYSNPLPSVCIAKQHKKQEKIVALREYIGQIGFVHWIVHCFRKYLNLFERIERRYIKKHAPKCIFLSTEKAIGNIPVEYSGVTRKYTHSWDYEQYLREGIPREDKGYILYIDEAMTHHPDWEYSGEGNPFKTEGDIQDYYRKMNHMFKVMEEYFHKPVIVAAHPRSHYNGNEFGSRQILKNQTNKLIARASLVLSDCSTAISWVVLYGVPLILLDELHSMGKQPSSIHLGFEQAFQKKRLIIEQVDLVDLSQYVISDQRIYAHYMNDYVIQKDVDHKKLYWDIVIDEIENSV